MKGLAGRGKIGICLGGFVVLRGWLFTSEGGDEGEKVGFFLFY